MELLCFFVLALLVSPSQKLFAQDQGQLLAYNGTDSPNYLAPPTVVIQDYYKKLIAMDGLYDRYAASEIALDKYGCKNEEYSSKLHNNLAEEAVLMRNFEEAKRQYNKVLDTDFEEGYYTEGLLAERSKLAALAGLRNVAIQEKDYATALLFHQRYLDSLQNGWTEIARRQQLANDKIFAICYQFMGESEQAITYLMPYAFGAVAGTYGAIDKGAIDHLTDLLRSKYPKKAYKRFLNNITNEIYTEQKNGGVLFYLQVLENRIYFRNDSANFERRVANDERLIGQGVAHYQRKLHNSYFYQSLFKK
jgi:hypothetical protein